MAARKALVTAAGQGIGLATARALAARGVEVLAATRSFAKLDGRTDLPATMRGASLDATDRNAVFALVERDGPFDILCNCSGQVHRGTILDCSEEEWRESFDQNVTAHFHAIQAVLPGMLARGDGAIVNLASAASSLKAYPFRAAYGASKAAVLGLTKAVARDFAHRGIRCAAVCPGPIDSDGMRGRIASAPDPAALRDLMVAAVPAGRLGTVEEVAAAMTFLALDATFSSGTFLFMEGGA